MEKTASKVLLKLSELYPEINIQDQDFLAECDELLKPTRKGRKLLNKENLFEDGI